MILDCCAQQRTYEKFFGLLAGVTDTHTHTVVITIFLRTLMRVQGSEFIMSLNPEQKFLTDILYRGIISDKAQ